MQNQYIMNKHKLSDYNYELPKSIIAQTPHEPADECKMLFWNWSKIEDKIFKDIPKIINKNSIIFINNSKVIKSRLLINKKTIIIDKDWQHKSINKWEIFFLKIVDTNKFEALVYPWKKLKPWTKIRFDFKPNFEFEIDSNSDEWRIIKSSNPNIIEIFDKYWQMPLPPYINYQKIKEEQYQPIFAKNPWSTASPTACLHFTDNLLKKLKSQWILFEYITLHIGLWTFKPIDTQDIKDYEIHPETVEVEIDIFEKIASLKLSKRTIVAIWTTVTRTLESLPYLWKKIMKTSYQENRINTNIQKKIVSTITPTTKNYWDNMSKKLNNDITSNIYINWNNIVFETKLFLYPNQNTNLLIIDELITNFHLPKSSLLTLVSSFMWYDEMFKCYKHAISKNYKFFSFWDAMYIKKT